MPVFPLTAEGQTTTFGSLGRVFDPAPISALLARGQVFLLLVFPLTAEGQTTTFGSLGGIAPLAARVKRHKKAARSNRAAFLHLQQNPGRCRRATALRLLFSPQRHARWGLAPCEARLSLHHLPPGEPEASRRMVQNPAEKIAKRAFSTNGHSSAFSSSTLFSSSQGSCTSVRPKWP